MLVVLEAKFLWMGLLEILSQNIKENIKFAEC